MKAKYWILITVAVLAIGYLLVKPNFSKGIYKLFQKELIEKERATKRKLDSVIRAYKTDSIRLNKSLDSITGIIEKIEGEKEILKLKNQRYEKELRNYRNGTFDERFGKFTELVTGTDSLQR